MIGRRLGHSLLAILALSMAARFFGASALAAQPFVAVPKAGDKGNAPSNAESAIWSFDRVELTGGVVYEGLIESESEEFVELLEVRRPRGKPMYLLVRPIERKVVQSMQRLSDADRETLRKRIGRFLNRASDEEKRLRSLELHEKVAEGKTEFRFQGFPRDHSAKEVWFTLVSTADDEATRRAIVRIEQAFVVFRQFFPPRSTPLAPPQFVLLGTTEEYADQLRAQKLPIKNPAYYSRDKNQVVAGSDLTRYADQIRQVRKRHAQLRQEHETLDKSMKNLLKELNADLEKQGFAPGERKKIVVASQGRWDRELAALEKQIRSAERMNAALFDEVANEMFARLYHESFHAYLDNYLFPDERHQVPRWLNEGCAQLFECGLWEGETLRVDAPHRRLLPRLQRALTEKEPLTLAQVLSADPKEFLAGHDVDGAGASRYYAYSWGLAYDLLIDRPPPSTAALVAYATTESDASPKQRFETLVGKPLETFEREWRARMLSLK